MDRVTLEVIGSALLTIAEEMGTALIKSAYSTNIKERQDCSTAIFDAHGEVIAQAEHIPMHLGSLLGVVREILARYPLEALAQGDVFIANDPYTGGGTHLPDINLVSPVFAGGALFGFVANIAHHADRSAEKIRTIWDEGLRITPIRLVEAGRMREDVMELLLANFALPHERRGDFRAQIAANRLGERRLGELIARHGVATVQAACAESLAYGERKIRAAIAALPDGVYRYTDAMDDDGVTPEPIAIAVAITKRGDSLALDFSGSGPQCAGDINVVYFALLATVYYALKAVLDPSIPANSGFYRAITVTAPEGSIVNARPPAPVAWRTQTCQRIADVVLGALAEVVPERVPAAGNGANCAMVFSGTDPKTGKLYVYLETLAGGAGATAVGDGMDAVQVHVTNTSNLPVESLESEYPLLVVEYALVDGSGGSGRHRGGSGLRRTIEILGHEARFLGTTERARIAPWGLFGGGPGGRARLVLNPGGPGEQELPPKVWGYPLRPGDRVSIDTPGAGGYGPPPDDGALRLDPRQAKLDAAPGRRIPFGTMACVKKLLLAVALVSSSATLLVSSDPAGAAIRLAPVLNGLDHPDFVTNARDGSHRLFVIEQPGVIRALPPGASTSVVFLDITARVLFGGDHGLLGLTFHPQFSSNGRFFVDYTRKPDGATVIAEYRVSAANPNVADGAETVLLVIPQPFADHHKGGMVEFGPDGFLYIGMGDGGSGNDPGNRAQNLSDLLGKILRIDVDHPAGGLPYSVPADNPFVGAAAGRGEIFAYGLRNPFRFSFDRATGDLYAGDVGQSAVEEIDIVRNGGNYGWRIWEGSTCTGNDPRLCSTAGFEFPIAEYGHTGGRCAVIGGYVYRGAAATLPAGSYVYGDLCTGEIFLLENGSPRVLLDSGLSISSFGEDEAGEIYAVSTGGSVSRLVNVCAPGAAGDPLCRSLQLSAGVNRPSFASGEMLSATVGFDNPGLADTTDVYIGVLLPDQTVVTFTSAGPGTSDLVVNFSSFAPLARGVALTTPFATTRPSFLVHQWAGSELRGEYTFFVLAVRAGAFADGQLAPDEILALATAPFSFQ